MREIRATYRCLKGTAPCERCPKDPNGTDVLVTFGGQKSIEDAERRLYESWFVQEMEIQNEKYRRKGNYGRIFTDIDEWRASPRHRPVETLFQIGSTNYYLPTEFLWDAYCDFYKWRRDAFPGIVRIGAAIYSGWQVPHIHERISFYYEDSEGVKRTSIGKTLQLAGLTPPFSKIKENRRNNCKTSFDNICRERWLDIVDEKIKVSYPDIRLVRPDPRSKFAIKFDRALRLEFKNQRTLKNSETRENAKAERLTKALNDLKEKQQEFQNEMDAEGVSKERKSELKEQMLIVKNKINEYNRRLEHAEKKSESIRATLNGN